MFIIILKYKSINEDLKKRNKRVKFFELSLYIKIY